MFRAVRAQDGRHTCIGGRDHPFPRMLGVSSTSAVNTASDPPIMRLIRQTMERCSGSYLALPNPTCMWHRAVFGGTGTWRWWRRGGRLFGLVCGGCRKAAREADRGRGGRGGAIVIPSASLIEFDCTRQGTLDKKAAASRPSQALTLTRAHHRRAVMSSSKHDRQTTMLRHDPMLLYDIQERSTPSLQCLLTTTLHAP